jgi:nitrate/TMAO reductase-like tetraheme cytochrome c subunit
MARLGSLSNLLKTRLTRRRALAIAAVAVVALAGGLLGLDPLTRKVVARDAICANCHLPWEFDFRFPDSRTRPMQAVDQDARPKGEAARCIECHLPPGILSPVYAYLHFFSITDLYGNFRDLDTERAGEWLPPRAATANRVRAKMFGADSNTCRTCHIESEIKPKRVRGQNAHKMALEQKKTCIECHFNLVHRRVDLVEAVFKKPAPAPAGAKPDTGTK